jgi:hypothetical protein
MDGHAVIFLAAVAVVLALLVEVARASRSHARREAEFDAHVTRPYLDGTPPPATPPRSAVVRHAVQHNARAEVCRRVEARSRSEVGDRAGRQAGASAVAVLAGVAASSTLVLTVAASTASLGWRALALLAGFAVCVLAVEVDRRLLGSRAGGGGRRR